MCWGVLEANQAIGSTYLLEADWVTISTNLWAYKSFEPCTSVHQSSPVIRRQINSWTLLASTTFQRHYINSSPDNSYTDNSTLSARYLLLYNDNSSFRQLAPRQLIPCWGGGGLGACPSKGLENIGTNRRSVAYNRVWLIKLISFLCSKAPRKKKISSASCPGGVGKTGKSDSSGSSESGSETHKSLGGSPLTQPRNASRCGAGGGGDQFKLKLGEFSGRSSRLVLWSFFPKGEFCCLVWKLV